MKTLIIGLGNPILGDDGVGWRVAEQVAVLVNQEHLAPAEPPFGIIQAAQVKVECLALGGLSLMEHLVGFDRAILIDAIQTGQVPVGSVSCFPLEALPNQAAGHLASSHDTTLQTALEMGRRMGAPIPTTVTVVAIEAEHVFDFSEILSPAVANAIPSAVEQVLQLIH